MGYIQLLTCVWISCQLRVTQVGVQHSSHLPGELAPQPDWWEVQILVVQLPGEWSFWGFSSFP